MENIVAIIIIIILCEERFYNASAQQNICQGWFRLVRISCLTMENVLAISMHEDRFGAGLLL